MNPARRVVLLDLFVAGSNLLTFAVLFGPFASPVGVAVAANRLAFGVVRPVPAVRRRRARSG